MRLLLDESVLRRFRHALSAHTVKTAVEMGWSGRKNGALLALAAAEFEAFITVDQNLPYQQYSDSSHCGYCPCSPLESAAGHSPPCAMP